MMTAALDLPITNDEVCSATPCQCHGAHHNYEPCEQSAEWMVVYAHVHNATVPAVYAVCSDCLVFSRDAVARIMRRWNGVCPNCRASVVVVDDILTVVSLRGGSRGE